MSKIDQQDKQKNSTVDSKGKDAASKKSEKKGWKKRDCFFLAASCAVFAVIGPYMYYTAVVYQHIYDHVGTQAGPEFSNKPKVTDFWISIVSGLVLYWLKKVVTAALFPLVRAIAH